jgi:tagatose-1,6-bisphosphate aldolase non-catalytic subunit AgaZ/GatZ
MIRGLDKHPLDEIQVRDALNQLDPIWDELFPAEQSRIVQMLIERVVVNPNGITVRFRSDGLSTIAAELEAPEETANE